MSKQSKLVTVAQFDNNFDAELARQMLESEQIEAFLFGQELAMNIPYLNAPILLQVFEDDAAAAAAILAQKHESEGDQ